MNLDLSKFLLQNWKLLFCWAFFSWNQNWRPKNQWKQAFQMKTILNWGFKMINSPMLQEWKFVSVAKAWRIEGELVLGNLQQQLIRPFSHLLKVQSCKTFLNRFISFRATNFPLRFTWNCNFVKLWFVADFFKRNILSIRKLLLVCGWCSLCWKKSKIVNQPPPQISATVQHL